MPKKTEDHIHKLKRIKFKTGNSVYFCALDCNFKIAVPLSLGKRVICWRCGEPFNMNEYSIRLARPHCEKCHKSKDGVSPEIKEFAATTQKLGEDITHSKDIPFELSLADRLSQTIRMNKSNEAEDEEI